MVFGKKLSIERKKIGLSAEDLANACDISRSFITLMENGKRLPGKNIIPKLARALHKKPNIIVNWYLEDIREKLL